MLGRDGGLEHPASTPSSGNTRHAARIPIQSPRDASPIFGPVITIQSPRYASRMLGSEMSCAAAPSFTSFPCSMT